MTQYLVLHDTSEKVLTTAMVTYGGESHPNMVTNIIARMSLMERLPAEKACPFKKLGVTRKEQGVLKKCLRQFKAHTVDSLESADAATLLLQLDILDQIYIGNAGPLYDILQPTQPAQV